MEDKINKLAFFPLYSFPSFFSPLYSFLYFFPTALSQFIDKSQFISFFFLSFLFSQGSYLLWTDPLASLKPEVENWVWTSDHPNLAFDCFSRFLFCIGAQLINNAVVVSGEQQRDSTIHTHVSILPQTPLLSRLPHNTEQSSLCSTAGSCWSSNTTVCTRPSQTP